MTLRPLGFLLFALAPPVAVAQQVLVVDDAHSQLTAAPHQTVPHYVMAAGPQLVVDASAYRFPPAAGTANSLQLVIANDQQYSVRWDPAHPSITVSSLTAHPNGNSKSFETFVAGQTIVVAIGRLEGTSSKVMWAGMADIK